MFAIMDEFSVASFGTTSGSTQRYAEFLVIVWLRAGTDLGGALMAWPEHEKLADRGRSLLSCECR